MPRPDVDRNLLFGIIGLQVGLIARDRLVAAMNAWATAKHRPLGAILVERGDLDPGGADLVRRMVDLRVAGLGGDAGRTLDTLALADETVEHLRRSVDDPEITRSLDRVATGRRADGDEFFEPETVDFIPMHAPARYRKLRDHARGGLGVVSIARDEELNRDVALKEIRPEYAQDPASQSRFLREAEVTGGLEHPGIVPVYSLGRHADGRPYYAMRLIRGDTLKHAIAAFHADESPEGDPGARTLALQKLLRRFLAVCDAVAYAHSRGIVHRDLKPDNVMVGQYGETLVVDWGLAKPIGKPVDGIESRPPSRSSPARPGSGPAETRPGSLIGTPAYMSPEQAGGRVDRIGPASDVYSLGVTLYNLLTGRLPFADEGLQTILGKVERGDFPRPREGSPRLDPALEAICLKAMAREPEGRYAGARDLADDLDRWLAGEPVEAYPEPWTRRARRWAGKHRTALATAGSSAIVAASLLGIAAWRGAERVRTVDTSARDPLSRAEALAAEARSAGDPARWERAVAEAVRAEDRLESGGGSPALRRDVAARLAGFRAEQGRCREVLDARERDRRTVDALEEARLRAAGVRGGGFDSLAKVGAYLAAFRARGIDVAALPVEEAARRIRSSPIADDLIAALDDWPSFRHHKAETERLAAIARAAETDPARAAIRDAAARRDAGAIRRLCESEDDRRKLGPRARSAFNALLRIDPAGSFPILEAIRREHPDDFWLNHDLGLAYQDASPPRREDAVRCLSIAVALRPGSPGALTNLGVALHDRGKPDEAIAEHREAIRLEPDYAGAHNNLGLALASQGKPDEAIAEYREAIRLQPDFATAHNNLGVALESQGKAAEAGAEYREAIRLVPDHDGAHNNLGNLLQSQGKPDEAIAEYREAIRLQPDSATAHDNLGALLKSRGDFDGAIAEHREAIRLRPDYATAHYNLGLTLASRGQADGAMAEYREAIRIRPDYAEAHCNLGGILRDLGDFRGSLESFERGHELGSRRPGWNYPSAGWVQQARRLVELEARLPAILRGEARPGDAAERLELADACHKARRYATAARFWAEAFADQPGLAADPKRELRHQAARSASLAGSGRGKDEPMPDEAARVALRSKALGWLRDDLTMWEEILKRGAAEPSYRQAVIGALTHWKDHPDLAGVRDGSELAEWPEAEREGCRRLWADVDALLAKAKGGVKP